MIVNIPFVGSQAVGSAAGANNQMVTNLYAETQTDGAKVKKVLLPTQGLSLLLSGGSGPCRGDGIVFNDNAYFVSGGDLVKITPSFLATTVGTLSTTTGFVKLTKNPTQLMISDSTGNGYIYNGTTLVVIGDADFPVSRHNTFMDSFFLVEDRDNVGRFYKSASNNGLTWAALEFATAENSPDDLFVPYALRNVLWLFGGVTTEAYGNDGNVDFPFAPIRGSRMEWGIQAENSLIQADNSLFWLAQNKEGGGVIVQARGFTPRIVSTRDIESEIDSFSSVTDCAAYSYQKKGHTFAVFNFPAADRTLVYDVSEKQWHRRKSFNIGRHRAFGHVFFNDVHIVGDYNNSNFYTYENTAYTDNGVTIERIRQAQYVHEDGKRTTIYKLEIEFEVGVGLVSGQGSDPQVILEISKDRGKTWGNKQTRSLGKIGEYKTRVYWNKLGTSRDWLFKITITDPVNVQILKAQAVVEPRLD